MQFLFTIFILLTIFKLVTSLPASIRIGAVFYENSLDSSTEFVFKYAIDTINRDKGILPDTQLLYDIKYLKKRQSFFAYKKVCEQINIGVQAVVGPSDAYLSHHIHSVCDALDIPHLETRIDDSKSSRDFSINLHPTQLFLNQAFLDVIHYLNWTKVGVLYEQDIGIIQMREWVKTPNLDLHIRQVKPSTYIRALNEFKNTEVHNIIIDINSTNMSIMLKGIIQTQMNEYKYHYLFTSFDIETFDLEDFKHNFVNLTAFRLVDTDDVGVKKILKDMQFFSSEHHYSRNMRTIKSESALIYDAIYIFAIGLQTLEQSLALKIENISCAEENTWNGGLSLINYINSVEWRGLTGPIQFKEGRRVQFKLDLVKLKQHSILKIGEWAPQTGLNITEPSIFFDVGSMNVTLVVITILERPYVMMHYGKNFTGNERFYGFCVDILESISREVGFDYILDLVPDRKYGAKNPKTGEWNGMVAQLMKYKADLAVGSMTITYARESVIDFTKPFMNLGISILFKVPSSPPTRLFSFMNPLAFDIWIYVLVAYVIVSLTMFFIGKLLTLECHNEHPTMVCSRIARQKKFTLGNSFWFTIGTLMQQGSDISPKSFSTRIVSAIWWFFTLIIIASYTANLAAFLTVERMITPIENAEDLASQTEISYGTLESGSTMTFFRDSLIETYRKMWRHMDNKKPTAFTSTYSEGINRVNEGNYAYLMESTMLDYFVQRNCNFTQIGGLLDTKGYGIATPKGSPWRDKISLAILELQEKGEIQMLYDKWWKSTGQTCKRKNNNKQTKANALGLDSIGGVFVVLIFGILIAIGVAILEFWLFYQQKETDINSKLLRHNTKFITIATKQRSFWAEMFEEFRYALHLTDSRRRPALKRMCPNCTLYKSEAL